MVHLHALSLLLATGLAAQMPHDMLLVLDASPVPTPNFHFVDAKGRGTSRVLGQSVFTNFVSVSTDPVDPSHVFYETSFQGFAGTWEAKLPLGGFGVSTWGPFGRTPALRIEVGGAEIYGIENDALFAVPKSGGTRRVLKALPGASDLAVAGPLVFACANSPLGAPLLRYDSATQITTTLTSLVSARAIAWSAATNELVVGTDVGALLRVDPANGSIKATTVVSSLPLQAVVVTSQGIAIYSDGNALYDERAPTAPLFVASAPILDIAIGAAPTASVFRYGTGCALDPAWAFTGLPSLGNLGFAVGVRQARPNALAVLVLGASRLYSTALGAALPFDLTPINMPGCALLADPVLGLGLVTDAAGKVDQPLPVPNVPAFLGEELVAQWIVSDPGANGLGLAVGSGAALRP